MDSMAKDNEQAMRILLEQEMDWVEQHAYHSKTGGLKHAAMASNQSLIKYVEDVLKNNPAIVTDTQIEVVQRATIPEIGHAHCANHVPEFAGSNCHTWYRTYCEYTAYKHH